MTHPPSFLSSLILALLLTACHAAPPQTISQTPASAVGSTETGPPPATKKPTPTNTPTPTSTPTATSVPTMAPSPTPTATATHAATRPPTPTPSPTSTATPAVVGPTTLNEMPYSAFILIDDEVETHIQEIYAQGQKMGRDDHSFSKLGDSLIANPYFLRIFDQMDRNLGWYNLGEYIYLQDVIDYYHGSFDRHGAAVRVGQHAWSVFDPMWANKDLCNPGEAPLPCEIRLHNPSIMLILLGTNDNVPRHYFEKHYEKIIQYLIEQGIVPILFTKADRHEGEDGHNNEAIRSLAKTYHLPLVEFDLLANTLPNRGLGPDNTHLRVARSHDFTRPDTFQYGTSVHNLATLIMLERVNKILNQHQ